MADYINLVTAADVYTAPLEIGPDYAARAATVTVAGNAALMQFAVGSVGNWRWLTEREFNAPAGPNIINSFTVRNVIGVRFRNAVPGAAAQIICSLFNDGSRYDPSNDDPIFESGLLSAGSISPNGSVTLPPVVGLLDTVRFPLNAPPQAIPNGAVTDVVWSNLVDWDSNVATFPSIGAPTTHLKVGVTGVYRVGVNIEWAAAAGTRLVRPLTSAGADLRIGQWVAAVAGQPTQQCYSAECQIGTGDFITIGVFQDSGGPLNVLAGWATLDRIA